MYPHCARALVSGGLRHPVHHPLHLLLHLGCHTVSALSFVSPSGCKYSPSTCRTVVLCLNSRALVMSVHARQRIRSKFGVKEVGTGDFYGCTCRGPALVDPHCLPPPNIHILLLLCCCVWPQDGCDSFCGDWCVLDGSVQDFGEGVLLVFFDVVDSSSVLPIAYSFPSLAALPGCFCRGQLHVHVLRAVHDLPRCAAVPCLS